MTQRESDRLPDSSPEWAQVKDVFLRTGDLSLSERAELLAQVEPDAVRRAVALLLRSEAQSHELDGEPLAALGINLDRVQAPPFGLPRSLGSYRIVDVLGHGTFSTVYRAEQDHPRRMVALKVLRHVSPGGSLAEAFDREVEALGRLRHPGIAQIYAAGVAPDGAEFLAMELIEGKPLTTFASERGLSVPQRVALMCSLCEAAAHAHQKGVIHRDLKPGNILVDAGGQPRILDFGLARFRGSAAETIRKSLNQVVGTLAYMSPEQAAGDACATDLRSDVYALGAVLFELLAGRPPIDTDGVWLPEALARIQRGVQARLGKLVPECRGDLDAIVHRALAQSPDHRYHSAADLGEDLSRHLASEPVLARPQSAVYVVGRYLRRDKRIRVAVCTAALFTLISVVWVSTALTRAERSDAVARQTLEAVAEMIRGLAPRAGTLEDRRTMVETALSHVEPMAIAHPRDPAVQRIRAELLSHKADLLTQAGRLHQSMRLREEALKLRRSIARLPAQRPSDLAALSIALVTLGDAHAAVGRRDTAEAFYAEALDIDEGLVAREPNEREWLDNLTWSYERRAHMCDLANRPHDARLWSERRIARARQLHERFPVASSDYALMVAYAFHATVVRGLEPCESERPWLEGGLELAEQLTNASPRDRASAKYHLHLLNGLGKLELGCGNPVRGRDLILEAVRRSAEPLALEPGDAELLEVRAGCLVRAAGVLLEQGENRAACELVSSLDGLDTRLGELASEHVACARRRAEVCDALACCLGACGEASEASAARQQADRLWEQTLTRFPEDTDVKWSFIDRGRVADRDRVIEITLSLLEDLPLDAHATKITLAERLLAAGAADEALRLLESLPPASKSDPAFRARIEMIRGSSGTHP